MNKRSSSFSNPTALALALALPVLSSAPLYAGPSSLWQDMSAQPRSMFADKKAHSVGDIITIIIQENNAASRNNNTTTSKKASQDASITSFFYSPATSGLLTKGGALPAVKYSSDNEFNGGGQIANQETITSQISARVIDVLPNGNLIIEGHKLTTFSGERQDAILRGTVRFDDITVANTVLSSQVADATIQFISNGAITDNQRRGWFTTIWQKLSPF